jgi:hypothetical protein
MDCFKMKPLAGRVFRLDKYESEESSKGIWCDSMMFQGLGCLV